MVKPNQHTGLAAEEMFYFGCAIGETGNTAADAVVNSSDVTRTRNNFSGFNLVGLESVYDFNRDGRVASGDVTISRNHFSGFTPLVLIAPPASAPLAADASGPAAAPLSAGSGDPRRALEDPRRALGDPRRAQAPLSAGSVGWALPAACLAPAQAPAPKQATTSAAAHDAAFSQSPDPWDVRLYADLAWSWELARPRPKQKPSEGDSSSQDLRQWMLGDYGT